MESARHLAARRLYGGDGSVPSYMENEVQSWSPEKIILKTYDLFLLSAKKNDTQKLSRILDELINSLNFEYPDQATPLFQMYDYCQRCVADGDVDSAVKIVQEMRETWAQAFKLA